MADKLPRIELYPGDWLRDSVSGCSLAAQGLWLRMMFLAHDSTRYGYLEVDGSPMQPEFIARRCGADDTAQYETLLSELVAVGVPSVTENGIYYSRRMVRDANLRVLRTKAGRKGGQQTAKRLLKQNAKQTASKRQAKPPPNSDNDNDNDNDDEILFPSVLECAEFREIFARWLAYKRERRESYKPTGLRQLIAAAGKKATTHGVSAVIEAMATAMANGWQGWDQKSLFGATNGQHTTNRVGAGQRYRGES